MKIMKIVALLFVFTSINIKPMYVSDEELYLMGDMDAEEYVKRSEDNHDKWGWEYVDMLRELATADYENYGVDLYFKMLYEIDAVRKESNRAIAAGETTLVGCARRMMVSIPNIIVSNYSLLKAGKESGKIK